MSLFNMKNDGGLFADVIRCDQKSYLIWKWHPEKTASSKSSRENEIRWGSSLRVKEGSAAVFVYKNGNGVAQEYIQGPFDGMIETKNFPVLSSIMGAAYDGASPFQAEIYFINLAEIVQIKLAVPYFDVFDPRFVDYSVPVAVRGMLTFKILDYKKFVKLHRLEEFDLDQFKIQIRDLVSKYIKHIVTNAPEEYNIPVIQLEKKILQISNSAETYIGTRLDNDFGICVSGLDIDTIDIDKSSNSYVELMWITKDIAQKATLTEAELNIRRMTETQKIELTNMAEEIRINREEDQYARHLNTQSKNISVYQIEKQAEVGIAGAEALGNMGMHGATEVSGAGGMNLAGMMTGVAMGGVIARNITNTMNPLMSGIDNAPRSGNVVPPLIPEPCYNVVINGQVAGPFDINTLVQMYHNGQITRSTLAWKEGMDNWKLLDHIEEIKSLIPPPVPPQEG